MRTLIVFREGLSGHFLKALVDGKPTDAKFRMDPWYPGIYNNKVSSDPDSSCHCSHIEPRNMTNYDFVLKILVDKNIYPAIYNVFFKKVLIEEFTQDQIDSWKSDLGFWYDKCYYHMRDYVELFRLDTENNKLPNVVNFDHLLDYDYMQDIFKRYFGRYMCATAVEIFNRYRAKQLQHALPITGKDMTEIISDIPDHAFLETPWYASYCIYKFEKNNNILESQRKWCINDISAPLTKSSLIRLSELYR